MSLSAFIRKWQKRLGLQHWRIEVADAPEVMLGTDHAQCRLNRTRRVAFLCLQPADAELSNSALHEMFHVFFDDLDEVAETVFAAGQFTPEVRAALEASYKVHLNQAIDRLTQAFLEVEK